MALTPKFTSDLKIYQPKKDSFINRQILITGATDGIGKALARACTKLGAKLILLGRNENKLNEFIEELSQASEYTHLSYMIDLSTAGEMDYIKFANYLASLDTPIDSVVLNAGNLDALQGIRNFQIDSWLRTITINLHAPFLLLKCCIPVLERAQDPSIVFSTHACDKAYWGAYGVAKSAQLGMMNILANELDGDKPIRVNGVDPAPVRTKLRTSHYPGINPQTFPAPEEVIAPYLYFIGPDSKGVTGVNYKINPDFCG